MQVILIGGGVVGLCSAYYLQKAGASVTIIDTGDFKQGCSYGNMGYVSPSHFIPIATPGIVWQGIKWMFNNASPFYIKPRLDKDLLQWAFAFWRNANAKNVEKNAPHLNNLLQLSRKLMKDLATDGEVDFKLFEHGIWMLYKNAHTGEHEKKLAEQANGYGLKTIVCNRKEVQNYEKDVEVDVAGGVLYQDDCHLNATELMNSLMATLKRKGVAFMSNTTVNKVNRNGNSIINIETNRGILKADSFVVANGSWMQSMAHLFGIKLLMQPGKGYSMQYSPIEKNLTHPSILVDHRVATTPIGNWLRIGGTMELSGHSNTILPKRVEAIYNATKLYYPALKIEIPNNERIWYGYRPVTPDGIPYIGKAGQLENVIFAGGHAMLGVSAAAGTGLLVSEIAYGRNPSIEIENFSPNRKM